MEHREKVKTAKKAGRKDEDTGGKAARVRRMRKGNKKTEQLREDISEKLYGEKNVK